MCFFQCFPFKPAFICTTLLFKTFLASQVIVVRRSGWPCLLIYCVSLENICMTCVCGKTFLPSFHMFSFQFIVWEGRRYSRPTFSCWGTRRKNVFFLVLSPKPFAFSFALLSRSWSFWSALRIRTSSWNRISQHYSLIYAFSLLVPRARFSSGQHKKRVFWSVLTF